MQYMNSITSSDDVENPKRAAFIFDSDFPYTPADTCKRPAAQRRFAELQKVELTANIGTDSSGKLPDNLKRIAVPVDVLKRLVRHRKNILNLVYFARVLLLLIGTAFCPIANCVYGENQALTHRNGKRYGTVCVSNMLKYIYKSTIAFLATN